MPTTLRTFPRTLRSGTQQTAYVNLPNQFAEIQILSDATDAVHSDPSNAIRFEVLHSLIGDGSDEKIIQSEDWYGGLVTLKGTSTPVPRVVNVTAGPVPPVGSVALRAIFSQAMVMGGSIVGLP